MNNEPKRPYYDPSKVQRNPVPVIALTAIVATAKGAIEVVTTLVPVKVKKNG
jgi:hypothetical protein